jgi:hypothetical protein
MALPLRIGSDNLAGRGVSQSVSTSGARTPVSRS